MTNKINFKKLKVGQMVWSIQAGSCKIKSIDLRKHYPIETEDYLIYTQDGKLFKSDKFPSLFLRKPDGIK